MPTHPIPSSLCTKVYSILTPGKAFFRSCTTEILQVKDKQSGCMLHICLPLQMHTPYPLPRCCVPGNLTTVETPASSLDLWLLAALVNRGHQQEIRNCREGEVRMFILSLPLPSCIVTWSVVSLHQGHRSWQVVLSSPSWSLCPSSKAMISFCYYPQATAILLIAPCKLCSGLGCPRSRAWGKDSSASSIFRKRSQETVARQCRERPKVSLWRQAMGQGT